ncbi:ATP-dependent DNA helicase Q1 [Linnemannia hyalina]|uniref:DNA 3'-5' helicase n=1 Tax=Linnemannia hyalina TaxID=64524 RepID=A0A9P7XT97_9FUNG|nr:ATP-dependent DNA helicase Q1 [Linnemannia hyalina]
MSVASSPGRSNPVMIDEVHCVEKWGKFREDYTRLGDLRVWAPGVPFVGLTATLSADAILQTKAKLFLSKATMIRVNEVRMNVRLEVHTQPKDAMKGLHSLLHKEKTIVYFETIAVLIRVFKCLQRIRPDLRGRLGLYFSTLDEHTVQEFNTHPSTAIAQEYQKCLIEHEVNGLLKQVIVSRRVLISKYMDCERLPPEAEMRDKVLEILTRL